MNKAKPDQSYTRLTVTATIQYWMPMIDDTRTDINGWTVKQVQKDWFQRHPLYESHASRDYHRIGFSEKIVDITSELITDYEVLTSDPTTDAVPDRPAGGPPVP